MAEVVLFHSVLGMRPGIAVAADRLQAAGHVVHIPNLFPGGEVFDDYKPAMARLESVGFKTLMARAAEALAPLPAGIVYAGFSMGAMPAGIFAAKRPGALGAILMHGAPPPAAGGFSSWPSATPVQIHCMVDDPWRDESEIAALSTLVKASGAEYALFDYPGSGHLFADPSMPAEYDAAAADLLWQRVLAFLDRIDAKLARG
jgi:dienelactone hydrolase